MLAKYEDGLRVNGERRFFQDSDTCILYIFVKVLT